nr:putative reverse transcriptase domain-containing protein [Tanacetum cinerariifolium]
MLKVSPWKGVIRFGKRGKLNPRYIRPFKVLAKVGTVAYRLKFPYQLSRVHSTFYVSNLKKCFSDEPLVILLDKIQIDDKIHFIKEPTEIMDREIKCVKQSHILIVKVRWNSRRGPEFTWEREDQMLKKVSSLSHLSTDFTYVLWLWGENIVAFKKWTQRLDLFSFIHHADPTKVRINKMRIEEGQIPLQESTKDRVDIVANEGVQAVVADKPKNTRNKRKAASGASGLLEQSTLAVEIVATTAVTVPFVTSSVTLTPERGGGGYTDSIFGPNLQTQHPDVRSSIPPPSVMTATVAATVVVSISSAPVFGASTELTIQSIFMDFASPSATGPDTAGPSIPRDIKLSTDTFYVSQEMDSKTLQQIYVPKLNVINDSTLDDPELFAEFNVGVVRQEFFSVKVRLRSKHNYRERKKFKRKCNRQADLLKEKDVEMANLKAQSSLNEDEATEAIHLCGQVAIVEAAKPARVNELDELKYEVVQDEHVKVLSDRVAGLDAEIIGMALHLDYEFYRRFLTTIVGRRWIIGHEFRLVVMKCLQSLKYVTALGMAIGLAVDKGMQTGLAAGINHGRARRSLTEVAAYDTSVEGKYISAVLALRNLEFNLLPQLELQRDASIADIMRLLYLEGPSTETPDGIQLQTSYEQLFLPIHRTKDNAEGASSCRMSILDAMGPLVEPSSSKNLVGEAITSGVLTTIAVTTALSTTFAHTGSVLPISVSDCDAEPHVEAPHFVAIVIEKEELETTP